jgi:glutamine synthetase
VRRNSDKEYILNVAKENDVKFIRLWFTDILGFLKSFAITVEELEEALEEGVGFDGSAIEGFARVDESDMVAMPDPTTFSLLPWRPREGGAVARVFCDILEPDGKPHEGDPRWVLRKNLKRAADLGFAFYVGPELEFFYFKSANAGKPEALDEGGYFDLTPLDIASDLRRETVLTLEQMGIAVAESHHEGAPSQHEMDLRYTDALTMADNVMTFRLVVKEVAMKHDLYATFMPKPIYGVNGSGMHVNMSLFKGNKNVLFDKNAPLHLSAVAKRFIAGLLRHAAEITILTNQWVNSYKRLVPGYEAPVYVTWAQRNRSDLVRIPTYRGHEQSTRIEYRSPDPACNPYLAFAAMLAAGLEGIEKKYEIPPAVERNVFEMTERERRETGIHTLPEDLYEAIKVAENSDLLRRCLGGHVFEKYIANKKIEWETYRAQVTDYELRRYLSIL